MKTYNVKQIAAMLSTSPETVRRWIRDDKLKAEQSSRKEGNIVTQAELDKFLKATPKYFSKISVGIGAAALSSMIGFPAVAGGILSGTVLGLLDVKTKANTKLYLKEIKNKLQTSIKQLNENIEKKQELVKQTEIEIAELKKQVEQFTYLLEHEELLVNVCRTETKKTEG